MSAGRLICVVALTILAGSLPAAIAAAEPSKVAGQAIAAAGPVTVTRPDLNPKLYQGGMREAKLGPPREALERSLRLAVGDG